MKKIKIKYCTLCGSKLEIVEGKDFNENTGKKELYYQCPNLKCERGCLEHGGHIATWLGQKCRRCGIRVADGDWQPSQSVDMK